MKNMCSNCDKKDNCVELCKEAEKYVNQDYIGQDEYISSGILPDIAEEDNVWIYTKDKYTAAGLKYLIIQLYKDGMSSYEMAYHLPCSSRYVREVIEKYEKALR